jgi:hypothetical protein
VEVPEVPSSLRGSVEFCSSDGLLRVLGVLACGGHKVVSRYKLYIYKV